MHIFKTGVLKLSYLYYKRHKNRKEEKKTKLKKTKLKKDKLGIKNKIGKKDKKIKKKEVKKIERFTILLNTDWIVYLKDKFTIESFSTDKFKEFIKKFRIFFSDF